MYLSNKAFFFISVTQGQQIGHFKFWGRKTLKNGTQLWVKLAPNPGELKKSFGSVQIWPRAGLQSVLFLAQQCFLVCVDTKTLDCVSRFQISSLGKQPNKILRLMTEF